VDGDQSRLLGLLRLQKERRRKKREEEEEEEELGSNEGQQESGVK